MNEGSRYQNSSAKVFAEEENFWGNFHPLDFFGNDRKPSASDGCNKYNDCLHLALWFLISRGELTNCSYVKWEVVLSTVMLTSTLRLHHGRHIEN